MLFHNLHRCGHKQRLNLILLSSKRLNKKPPLGGFIFASNDHSISPKDLFHLFYKEKL